MKIEYPKMVYKSRNDCKIATCLEDEEQFLKLGYGSADIILSGKKPKEVVCDHIIINEPQKFTVKPAGEVKVKRKRRTRAEMKNGNSK